MKIFKLVSDPEVNFSKNRLRWMIKKLWKWQVVKL